MFFEKSFAPPDSTLEWRRHSTQAPCTANHSAVTVPFERESTLSRLLPDLLSKSHVTFTNVSVRLRMFLSLWAEGIGGPRVPLVDPESPRCLCQNTIPKPVDRKTPINMVFMMINMILLERIITITITFLLITEYLNKKSGWNYVAILLKHFLHHLDCLCVFRTFWNVCLFYCLFGVFRTTREFFTNMETPLLPVKGCKFWPTLRHLWPLSSEGSLACHTYNELWHVIIRL